MMKYEEIGKVNKLASVVLPPQPCFAMLPNENHLTFQTFLNFKNIKPHQLSLHLQFMVKS